MAGKKDCPHFKITPSGMPLKHTENAFFEASIFEKSAIKYPIFGVF